MNRPKSSTAIPVLSSLLLYAVLVVALTWPLAANLTTKIPRTHPASDCDTLLIGWALGHQTRSLLGDPAELYHGEVFYPSDYALLHGEAGFGALPLFMPVFALTGDATLALNFTFLGGLVLTAWTLHLVAVWWTGFPLAGFAAATTFLTTPFVLWSWIPVATNYACLFWFPLIIFRAAAPLENSRGVLALAALVVLQGAVSHYIAAAVCGPLLVLGVARLLRRRSRREGALLLGCLALSALVLAAIYGPHILYQVANPDLVLRSPWRLPALLHRTRIPGEFVDGTTPASIVVPAAMMIVLGGAVRLLTRAGSVTIPPRIWTTGLFWASLGYIASVTPTIEFFGARISLPQAWIAKWVPLWSAIRIPERIAIASLMGLALLVGAAVAEVSTKLEDRLASMGYARRGPRAVWALCIALSFFLAYRTQQIPTLKPAMPAAFPLQDSVARQGPLLDVLRESEGTLVELPGGPRNVAGYKNQTRAMFRSLYHGRPTLNGYSGYWPAGYLQRSELADALPDAEALRALQRDAGLNLILVNLATIGESREVWERLAQEPAHLRLLARDGDRLLFVVARE